MQLRREADLGVHDAVGRQVLGTLARHPLERIPGLHDRDGVLEALEVALQRPSRRARDEPLGQLRAVGGRQPGIADRVGELEHGRRAQATVEVVVQKHLGGAADGGQVGE